MSLVICTSLILSRSKFPCSVFHNVSIWAFISVWYSAFRCTTPSWSSFFFNTKNLWINCSFVVVGSRNILKQLFVIFSSILMHFWRRYWSKSFWLKPYGFIVVIPWVYSFWCVIQRKLNRKNYKLWPWLHDTKTKNNTLL